MYHEIQTEYLPIMLRQILRTLERYCSRMSNLNMGKSLLLCINILNKVHFSFKSHYKFTIHIHHPHIASDSDKDCAQNNPSGRHLSQTGRLVRLLVRLLDVQTAAAAAAAEVRQKHE